MKGLIHDLGDKVGVWRGGFGAQGIPIGVIAGLFNLKNPVDAQDKGIAIVWERDLAPISELLEAAR